jgi:hypothetical protein
MVVNTKLAVAGLAAVLLGGVIIGRVARRPEAAVPPPAGTTTPATSTASPVASHPSAPAPKGMRGEPIHDPALNMDAFTVTIPADWHFQGAFFPGTACSQVPFPVYRAYSPDGLTEVEGLPRLDWTWSNLPYGPKTTQPGCLPLKEAMTASEFLKYLSATLEVEYVGEVPVAADILDGQKKSLEQFNALSAQNAARMHAEPMSQRGETAQAKVRYRNGTTATQRTTAAPPSASCARRRGSSRRPRSRWTPTPPAHAPTRPGRRPTWRSRIAAASRC